MTWAAQFDSARMPVPGTIAVEQMELLERERPPVFEEVMVAESSPQKPRALPLVVYDLNSDGLSEIVLSGQNLVVWNLGGGKFETLQFLQDERSIFDAAILADLTGDGPVDFVAVDDQGVPLLFEGDAEGRFDKPGVEISEARFILPKVFTVGDVDADGDLDLYIANYKFPYRQGLWPTPYYGANDGYPAYLLRNDGEAGFTDITVRLIGRGTRATPAFFEISEKGIPF